MASKYAKALAENLKDAMGNKSISEFAKEIGISRQALSRYLLCQREINLENLCKIADYLNEDIDILLGRKDY